MAAAQTKTEAAPSTDDLAQQIDSLRADISAIATTLGKMGRAQGEAAIHTARGKAQALKAEGDAVYEAAAMRASEAAAQAEEAVRQRPATALGIAMGVGFLIGYLTGRK